MTSMQPDPLVVSGQTRAKVSLPRHALTMSLVTLLTLVVSFPTARALVSLSLHDERYSHLLFAPLFCVLLIHWRSQEIFVHARYSPRLGVLLLAPSLFVGVAATEFGPSPSIPATLIPGALAIVVAWTAGFTLCYGLSSVRAAVYPLACLLLAVPVPATWMDRIISLFQRGSAAVTYTMFETFGVSVFREGMNFSIPGLNFNIAPECSGIHSGVVFLVLGILCAYLFLRNGWLRVLLILATVPIAIFKNAVRIVVITLLGSYVNRAFIDGPFHHKYSGLIFAPLDLVLFVPILLGLYKLEASSSRRAVPVK